MELKPRDPQDSSTLITLIQVLVSLVVVLIAAIVFFLFWMSDASLEKTFRRVMKGNTPVTKQVEFSSPNESKDRLWIAPEISSLKGSGLEAQILYGRELIMHTSKYLGPRGSVASISNGMNCQNCHLDAGTRIYGNNYGSVYSTYPRFRARSGSVENIYKRVNDCLERSLNGQPLDTMSAEMQAIKAYLIFLGKNVAKGTQANGSGLKNLPYLDRPADPVSGKEAYLRVCSECHRPDGAGIMAPSGDAYTYPPLWGPSSYNDAAGLYRLSNFAKYIKYNMPLGVTYTAPQLTDEEAWDIAAYVNSMPRPHKDVPGDWPDITKKPVDHPFGPYSDAFAEQQHKYGPFSPMLAKGK